MPARNSRGCHDTRCDVQPLLCTDRVSTYMVTLRNNRRGIVRGVRCGSTGRVQFGECNVVVECYLGGNGS
jgi:hypothetical protein